MTSALNMPKPLIMPPSTRPILSSGPPNIPAMSAQEPVSQAVGASPVSQTAAVGIVGLTYILPVAAVWLAGLAPPTWGTGFLADIAGMLGRPLLMIGLVLGG